MQLKEVKLSKSTGFQLKEAAVQIVRVHSFHSLGAKTTKQNDTALKVWSQTARRDFVSAYNC